MSREIEQICVVVDLRGALLALVEKETPKNKNCGRGGSNSKGGRGRS